MQTFSGDCGCSASVAEVDGCAWCVGIGGVAAAELPKIVSAPASDLTVVEECARVITTRGDCGCGASGAEVDGCAWCVGVGGVAVAELPSEVVSPAGDLTVVEECARVVGASGDCGGGASGAEVDGVAGCIGVGVFAVAELTVLVVTPASDLTIVK